MRALLIALLLPLAACDSRADVAPYDGRLDVSAVADAATGRPVLRLVAADDTNCALPLVVRTGGALGLDLTVVGIAVPPPGGNCEAIMPASATLPLPTAPGTYPVRIRHAGSTERYAFEVSSRGWGLSPVETRTSRPAPDAPTP